MRILSAWCPALLLTYIRNRILIVFRLAELGWRRGLRCAWLMVMLIAGDGEHPPTNRLTMHRFGSPRAIRLLGVRLMFRRHALVRPPASIADQVAADHLVVGYAGATDAPPVRARLDDLVAILGDAIVEVGDELLVAAVDARVGNSDSLKDAKHGGGGGLGLTVRRNAPARNDAYFLGAVDVTLEGPGKYFKVQGRSWSVDGKLCGFRVWMVRDGDPGGDPEFQTIPALMTDEA